MGSQSETAAAIKSLIDSIIDYKMDNTFTSIPCYIVKIHDSLYECKVDVIPALEKLDYDGISTEEPVIYGVPVQFPSSSRSALTFPLREGDPVICIFCRSNIESFKATKELGTITSPDDYRTFSYRDAIAIPCVWPFDKSINDQLNRTLPHDPDNLVVAHNIGQDNEIEIRFTDDGIKINAPNSDVSVNAVNASITALESVSVTTTTASVEAQQITLDAATIDLNGILNINGAPYAAHTHGYTDNGNPLVTTPPVV